MPANDPTLSVTEMNCISLRPITISHNGGAAQLSEYLTGADGDLGPTAQQCTIRYNRPTKFYVFIRFTTKAVYV